jgi:hypothetical protein
MIPKNMVWKFFLSVAQIAVAIQISASAQAATPARKADSFLLGALYTPVSDFMLQSGVYVEKAISPDLRLGLSYLGGSDLVSSSEDGVTADATLKGTVFAFNARYFLGSSFNVLGGIAYRSATIDYKIADATFSINGEISATSMTIPLFIGNSWAWDNGFTVGVDWIGAFVPLTGASQSEIDGNLPSDAASDLNDKLLDLGVDLSKRTSLTLLLTSIGWAF